MKYKQIKSAIKPLISDKNLYKKVKAEIKKVLAQRTKQVKIDDKVMDAVLMAGGPGFKIYSLAKDLLLVVGNKQFVIKESDVAYKPIMRYVNLKYQPVIQKDAVKKEFDQIVKEKAKAEKVMAQGWDEAEILKDLVEAFGGKFEEEIKDSLSLDTGRYNDRGDAGEFTADGEEYIIIKDEDEAESIALETVTEDLESEPAMFNKDFLESHIYITDTDRRILALEEANNRAEDLRYELNKEHWDEVFNTTDLYKEEGEALIEKIDIEEDETKRKALEKELLDLAEKAIEEWESQYSEEVEEALKDPIQYFVKDQGIYTMEDLMKVPFIVIDIEEAAKESVNLDGWAHFLSMNMGDYKTTSKGYVYFKE